MKKRLLIILSIFMAVTIAGCADTGDGSGGYTGIGCNNTDDYQLSIYGSVASVCLPADFFPKTQTLSIEPVYYKVYTNTSGHKAVDITFYNQISADLRKELKNTFESYYGRLINIGTDHSIWSGCNQNSSIKYEEMHAGIAVNFEFGAECVYNGPAGIINTDNTQNASTWEEKIAPLLPADYPIPVTHIDATLNVTGEHIYYIHQLEPAQAEQVISILKNWYNSPLDTFVVDADNGFVKNITATHMLDTEPHTLIIAYFSITKEMMISYKF